MSISRGGSDPHSTSGRVQSPPHPQGFSSIPGDDSRITIFLRSKPNAFGAERIFSSKCCGGWRGGLSRQPEQRAGVDGSICSPFAFVIVQPRGGGATFPSGSIAAFARRRDAPSGHGFGSPTGKPTEESARPGRGRHLPAEGGLAVGRPGRDEVPPADHEHRLLLGGVAAGKPPPPPATKPFFFAGVISIFHFRNRLISEAGKYFRYFWWFFF